MDKKTKVVCTIGPVSESSKMLEKLIKAGMNVARLNFSHGDHQEHLARINKIREISDQLNKPVGILLDTKGPEIRTHDFENGEVTIKGGQVVIVSCEKEILGTSSKFSITYQDLYKDVKVGGFILVNDGQLALLVDHVEGKDIYCVSANEGILKNRRGINVPDVSLNLEYLSEKDINDIIFGCQQHVDFIAASFVRRAQDVIEIKKILVEHGKPEIQIIAKIENSEGVKNIDEILNIADGIMVARGDLGVEVPAEDVPMIQKMLIAKCNATGKAVITATQMLESMQTNPRPTRAEVSDVANAIMDGSDAIMLSGESAAGKYPEESVETMVRIAERAERALDYSKFYKKAVKTAQKDQSEAICMSVAEIAYEFEVNAIIAFTITGFTARKLSRYRPKCPVIAATTDVATLNKLSLTWGVTPVLCKSFPNSDVLLRYAEVIAKQFGMKAGDNIIVTGGTPGSPGQTNFLHLVNIK